MNATFPLAEIRAALKLKVKDQLNGHAGPVVAVMHSRKYDKPMLTFCTDPQNSRDRCRSDSYSGMKSGTEKMTTERTALKKALLDGIAARLQAKLGYLPDEAQAQALLITDLDQAFSYEKWRHRGWYVSEVRYPSGACGCVSNNYPDKKWRIACDDRRINLNAPGDFTFRSREDAARAEHGLAIQAWEQEVLGKDAPQEQTDYAIERSRG